MAWGKRARRFLLWGLPGLTLVVLLICSFLFWVIATQSGTRLLLTTTAKWLNGQATAVQGSVWHGLNAGRLSLNVAGTQIDIETLHLVVDWKALGQRRLLHVRELSVGQLKLGLPPPSAEASTPQVPFEMPALPVTIAVDQLNLGALAVTQNGQAVPVSVSNLAATLALSPQGGQVRIARLHVAADAGQAELSGALDVQRLADPWPFSLRVDLAAQGSKAAHSPLCEIERVRKVLDTSSPSEPTCRIELRADAIGSLDSVQASLAGSGSGLALEALVQLAPRTPLVLQDARVQLHLPDASTVTAQFNVKSMSAGPQFNQIVGQLSTSKLNLEPWLGETIPAALLSMHADVSAEVENLSQLNKADVSINFDNTSRWNKQTLDGAVKASLTMLPDAGEDRRVNPLAGLQINNVDIDLTLGRNQVRAQGNVGMPTAVLTLDVNAPQLDAFWPAIPGGASLKGKIAGMVAEHQANLTASYTPAAPRAGVLGAAPIQAELAFAGGWGHGQASHAEAAELGWRGTLSKLSVATAGWTVATDRSVTLDFLPAATEPLWQWQVGNTAVSLTLPDKQRVTLTHRGSRGGGKRWETAGDINNLVITKAAIRQVMAAVDQETVAKIDADPQTMPASLLAAKNGRIALDLLWDVKFDGRLAGNVRLTHRDGDVMIPAASPLALGLQALTVNVTARPISATNSRVEANVALATAKMGRATASASTVLTADDAGGINLDARQPILAKINAEMADLTWLGVLAGDAMDIGGKVNATIDAQGTLAGKWSAKGTVQGEKLRVVRIDDGVRLLDGRLSARLEGDRLILDSLRFPALLRVMPAEWRTKEWLTSDPGAKDGYVEASGEWGLTDGAGKLTLTLYRFPMLQRSDRYAMISGTVGLNTAMPHIDIVGDLKADAGWVSLEILQGIPSLDDDVKVRHSDESVDGTSTPIQTSMNLKFDMGPRFYITGMGLDAGLLGAIQIQLNDGRLTGVGALRTRGGGIEAYGQKLRLRRGTLTFQGRIDNPVLDIEALRTGEQVEAGVRVAGTAQRPRIDLVSYPDVSDVEKLSWLLLGRGPDSGGGDAALLMSVGTALLGGSGPPLYKQFGLDDVSIRTGAIGSSGTVLPDRTVASDVTRDSSSQLATQFLVASKNFGKGITVSLEQALSSSATVGRFSYRLARGLSADLKVGTVNGIGLVYRTLFGK